MKIKKYTPPDSLKQSVMEKITDDGYAKELVSLPETAKKKTRILPYLTTAAAITLVFCATLYVTMGADRKSDKGTSAENEFSVGSTGAEEESPIMDADKPITEDGKGDGVVIQGSVTNDNAFVPEDDFYKEDYGEDENRGENADKSNSAPSTVTVTLGDKSATLSAYDSARVRTILSSGEAVELDCINCTCRYTIEIDGENYAVHNECGNVERGHCILSGISVPELDGIVKNYIDIE